MTTGKLQGKRAVVTGAASGIGRAAALKLAEEGAAVGVLDVNLEAAREVADVISKLGRDAVAIQVDVRVEQQVADAIDTVAARFGGLDTLVPNAGVLFLGRDAAAADLNIAVWRETLDINLTGMFLTCKHGIRALQRNRGGAVVITSSPTGAYGCAPTFTAYSSSKAGTIGLMRILAVDYVSQNIRVNAVFPGTTKSPLINKLMENPVTRAEFVARIPMGRAAETSEIANVIAFLASDEASYVTGAEWYADGGLTAV
jgi:NAD(P)-dependent dehydrogenase (short-subunit alcohol dehydrogenase family)